ncbi:MAG: LysR family transcriptional regulator, partial [Hyphomicrobiaceae bacterium]
AEMQISNWNDLRYLLAVSRGQTLRAAARQLRVDDTTVARRLSSLERQLGKKLVQRRGDRRLTLTEAGQRVAKEAEAIERHYDTIATTLAGDRGGSFGTVRMTAVPILVNRLFARNFGALSVRNPGVQLELIPDSRDLSLTRREADIAVRLARPSTGGMAVKTSRIGTLSYAAYAANDITPKYSKALPWITYENAMSHLPHARWMEREGERERHGASRGRSALRVHDAETALEAVAAGEGKTLLPKLVADGDPRLRKIKVATHRPIPVREIWQLAHADDVEVGRLVAVMDWIRTTVAGRTSR